MKNVIIHRILWLSLVISTLSCTQKKSDRFVDLDGHKQRILDKGEGTPVVIFITGAGAGLNNFSVVQDEVAGFTRTFSYDRAGLGLSEELKIDRSIDHFADELNRILEAEDIQPPYLLVGHALGGFTVRWFAHTNPEKVVGMVLIDPAYEGFMDSLRNTRSDDQRRRMKDMVNLGISNQPKATQRELEQLKRDEELVRSTKLPVNIPITMLTSGRFSDEERKNGASAEDITKWVSFHEQLKLQAPQLKHIVTEKSGSFIHQEEPELVISEIRAILETIKQQVNTKPSFSKPDTTKVLE